VVGVDRLSPTTYAILGLLTFGEMSGYDVMKLAERSIGHFWTPAKSHVYAELRRIASLGYATAHRVEQERRPDKTLYSITESGRAALRGWLAEPEVVPDQLKSTFTMKVFFGDLVPRELLVAQIKEVRRRAQERLGELRATEERIRGQQGLFYPYLTLKAGLAYTKAEIEWTEEALAELERRDEA
jgi:PadR family transcriptional regulator AphA